MLCLNLGCGPRLMKEPWVNADILDDIGADVVMDINLRWPWPDDTFDQLWANHCLEHGWDKLHLISELWRVCKPGAQVEIVVPLFSWPEFWNDPTHKSCWAPKTLDCFIQGKGAHTALFARKIEFLLKSFAVRSGKELYWYLQVVRPGIPDRAEAPIPIPTLEQMK